MLGLVRAFAVLVLDAAATTQADDEVERGVRVLKVAVKAGRWCLEAGVGDEEGLMRVLECAAGWEGRLKGVEEEGGGGGGGDVDAVEVARRLRAEYWVLRTAHVSWFCLRGRCRS